jgi:cytoskeletal protein CcmA (bactofilin family)
MTPPQAGFFFATRQRLVSSNEYRAKKPIVKKGRVMKVLSVFLAAAVVWACAGGPESMAGDGRDLSSVNKSVSASAGESYGSLSTVNGDVRVGRGASATEAKTVNGSIRVEEEARLGNVSTVNGSVNIAEGVSIEHAASTVNGQIEMRRRSRVGGEVATVNGDIELAGTEVGGGLTTRNGDIDLTDGTRIRGDIHVKESKNWGWKKADPVDVTICGTCVVDGDLRFERPVRLRVESGAKIGKVIGDEVTRL